MKKRTLEGLWQQWGLGREQQKVEGKQQRAQSTCCGRACNWTNCVTKSCSKMCSEVIAHCLTLLHLYVHSQYLSYYKQLFYTYINDAPPSIRWTKWDLQSWFFLRHLFLQYPWETQTSLCIIQDVLASQADSPGQGWFGEQFFLPFSWYPRIHASFTPQLPLLVRSLRTVFDYINLQIITNRVSFIVFSSVILIIMDLGKFFNTKILE